MARLLFVTALVVILLYLAGFPGVGVVVAKTILALIMLAGCFAVLMLVVIGRNLRR